MPAPVTKRIMQVVTQHLAPPLLEVGFKRSKRVFRRDRGEAIDIIEIQLGKYNEGERGTFTIELGVFFPTLMEMVLEMAFFAYFRPYIDNPTPAVCAERERLGMLLPTKDDTWWRVTEDTDVSRLGNVVKEDLVRYGLPWFDSFRSVAALAESPTTRPGIFDICARVVAGDQQRAREALRAYLVQCQRPHLAQHVKEVKA